MPAPTLLAGPDFTAPYALAEPGFSASYADSLKGAFSLGEGDTLGPLMETAARETMLARLTSSRTEAMAEAAGRRIETVQQQTGVQLENPFRQGYYLDAQRRYDEARARGEDPGPRALAVRQYQRDIFTEKLDETAQKFPDKAPALSFYQSIEQQAGAIATGAEHDAAAARAAVAKGGAGAVPTFLAELAGGLAGMRRDPVSILSLGFGPSTAAGRTIMGRVASASAAQGLFNVGLAALEKPGAAQWRAERGLDPGSQLPSIGEVGLAFAMGAIPGAAVQGVIEASGLRALRRVMAGEPEAGDIGKALRSLGVKDGELEAALQAGRRAQAADAAIAGDRLPDTPAALHDEAVAQAARHQADPVNEPPPAVIPAIGRDATPDRAIAIMDTAADPIDGVLTLRGEPDAIAGALASERPEIRQAGRLAQLSDEALDMVRDGRALPEHGVVVSELTPRPEWQAEVLARVEAEQPIDARQARLIAADAVEGLAERERTRLAWLEQEADASDRAASESVDHRPIAGPLKLKFYEDIPVPVPETRSFTTIARHEIVDGDGRRIGVLDVEPKDAGRTLEVVWVGHDEGSSQRLNLGPRHLRDLLRQLREIYPDAVELTGMRISGAHKAGTEDVKVQLPPKEAELRYDDPLAQRVVTRDDGSIALVPRDAVDQAGARDLFFGDLVKSCK